ncbi:uncharacterized protein LOC111045550 [Nilaparvata lugens]|uniref:uncharacterized protein LOC111045550 n=1 Tax=Nilaparvata lugens TaxID=108931 RepID=UPI000B9845FE|nr:uncharacterized protein LOC111045550 [Nilaparvata lugens]
MDSMSKKERLARGSAVIKVMRVNPRPGRFLKSYIDVRSLPKRPQPPAGSAAALAIGQPHLDVKNANFEFNPYYARVSVPFLMIGGNEKEKEKDKKKDPCGMEEVGQGDAGNDVEEEEEYGLPDGDKRLGWYGYREWAKNINPTHDGNIAEHINVLLGLLISMAADPDNENFPDVEAYPCVQFLRSVKSPDGDIPYNCKSFIAFIEYTCMKILEES